MRDLSWNSVGSEGDQTVNWCWWSLDVAPREQNGTITRKLSNADELGEVYHGSVQVCLGD